MDQKLKPLWQEDGIIFFEALSSTQDWAKEFLQEMQAIDTVGSVYQTKGRGRGANLFESPIGGLYFTWIDHKNHSLTELDEYTLKIAQKIKTWLQSKISEPISIKIPNDLYLQGKKCAGILCERSVQGAKTGPILVGVGLNLNTLKFPESVESIAISLKQVTGQDYDLKLSLKELIGLFRA